MCIILYLFSRKESVILFIIGKNSVFILKLLTCTIRNIYKYPMILIAVI